MKFCALPFQLVFVIAAGVLLRGTLKPWRWYTGLLLVWFIVGAGNLHFGWVSVPV